MTEPKNLRKAGRHKKNPKDLIKPVISYLRVEDIHFFSNTGNLKVDIAAAGKYIAGNIERLKTLKSMGE